MPRKQEYIRLEARKKFNLYKCRCSKCEARRTFVENPKQIVKTPKCKCGSKLWRVDWYRTTRKESRRYNCYCPVVHFKPHNCRYCAKGGRHYKQPQYDNSAVYAHLGA